MMIPITRKEKYINEIVGGGNTAPETPQTREEIFFADILGEVVAPSPITRAEKYLAKIASKYSGELPEPVTKIERFLARAAGMNVSIPTPVTREEMFWADYALIVEKEISGVPPLTFNAIAGTLKNYRIYGNTENGESVGDRTANLFSAKLTQGGYSSPSQPNSYRSRVRSSDNAFVFLNAGTYTISWDSDVKTTILMYAYNSESMDDYNSAIISAWTSSPTTFPVTSDVFVLAVLKKENNENIIPGEISNIMLSSGSTPLPYEPYGYRVPVTVNDIITNIYLDEPLAKSGNNADYIDYATQKRRNSDGTESSVTLPEISTLAGTNMLSVGTEVQPSNVYIKYEGAR